MRTKSSNILHINYSGQLSTPIIVESEAEVKASSHYILAQFSKRSFASPQLTYQVKSNVERLIKSELLRMGCQSPRLQRKRRKYLRVVKQNTDDEEDLEEETSDRQVVGTDLDVIDLSSSREQLSQTTVDLSSSQDDLSSTLKQLVCGICDQSFVDDESLSQHSQSHNVSGSVSSFITNLEDNIYEQILAETPDINKSDELSESLLDNYDDLVDNLIASVSPDEILDKIVINNEYPDNFTEKALETSKLTGEEESTESNSSLEIFTKTKKRSRDGSCEPSLIKKPGKRARVNPEKVYTDVKNFKGCPSQKIEVKTERVNFSLNIPQVISVQSLEDDMNVPLDPTLDKMFKTSMSRIKKFQDSEKLFDDKYRSNRSKFNQDSSREELRTLKRRSCKRGALAYTVYSDLKNIATVRKNAKSLRRFKEESRIEIEMSVEDGDSIVDDPLEEDVNEENSNIKPREKVLRSLSPVEVNQRSHHIEEESSPDLNLSMPILEF